MPSKLAKKMKTIAPVVFIEQKIYFIRGKKVMLDSDLAELYDVTTKRLNEQVKRNSERFPGDFMFKLNFEEEDSLRSQIATTKKGRGGRRYLPYVFTEHGAVMLAGVLNSQRAIEASIFVVRAFIRMREIFAVHKELDRQMADLERRIAGHDEDIKALITAIRQLIQPPHPPKKQIGFKH